MQIKKQITAALATGALMLNLATPALADTTLQISGNGRNSDNDVVVDMNKETSVYQDNDADIDNNVDVNADTGGNKANDNSGGDVSVRSGNADVTTSVSNTANKNVADIDCCEGDDTKVVIEGNKRDSSNTANLDLDRKTKIDQDNDADIDNDVDVDARTGGNRANDNSDGSVEVRSGDATVTTDVTNKANFNVARVGGGNGDEDDSPSLTLRIANNGRNSDNDIVLDLYDSIRIDQDNDADIDNDVDVDAKTGGNKANDNWGGDVLVRSGDADVTTVVDTWANFNSAELGCDCLLGDVKAVIDGNGRDSDNNIDADLDSKRKVDQDNDADVDNDVDVDAKTGYNKANDNSAGDHEFGDPEVRSGDSTTETEVSSSANWNLFGEGADDQLPELHFGFNFDLSDFLDWWAEHHD